MGKDGELRDRIEAVISGIKPYELILGDCRDVITSIPPGSIDCVITSPPYWRQREYEVDPEYKGVLIGNEDDPREYVGHLVDILNGVMEVLKPSGSLWLNLGDKYHNKNLMGMPWRVALALQERGWILRNDVIWDRMKGTQSAKDRLRSNHEHIFHLVKARKYYYDGDSIRVVPDKQPTVNDNEVVSATGVSGKRYRQQIETSRYLSEEEKRNALAALDDALEGIRRGEFVDFRMTIRGTQRTLHSDNGKVSGRARELEERGFFILTSYAKGYMPSDIWRIVPEDVWRKDAHYAVFPEELLRVPILATCPPGGVVLDPFMGTGSAVSAAVRFGRRGIGVDISSTYIEVARKRLSAVQTRLPTY